MTRTQVRVRFSRLGGVEDRVFGRFGCTHRRLYQSNAGARPPEYKVVAVAVERA